MIYVSLFAMIFCLIWFLKLWQIGGTQRVVFTPFLVFAIFEFITVWPSALNYYFVSSESALPSLVASFAFLFFLVGYSFAGPKQKLVKDYAAAPLLRNYSSTYYMVGIIMTSAFLFMLSLYHYRGIPPILSSVQSFLFLDTVDTANLAAAIGQGRYDLTKTHWFGGEYRGQGLIRSLLTIGWTYLLCVSICLLHQNRQYRWWILSGFLFLSSFLFIAGDGTRAPFLFSMVIVLITLSLIKVVTFRTLGKASVVFFVLLVMLSLLSNKAMMLIGTDNVIATTTQLVLDRLVFSNGTNTAVTIDFVDKGILSPQMGRIHVEQLISALPGVQYGTPFSYQLYRVLNPMGTATTFASVTYLAMLYADFGIWGTFAGYLLLGVVMAWLQNAFFRSRKNVLYVAIFATLIMYLGRVSLGSPTAIIANSISLLGIYLFFKVVATIFSLSRHKHNRNWSTHLQYSSTRIPDTFRMRSTRTARKPL